MASLPRPVYHLSLSRERVPSTQTHGDSPENSAHLDSAELFDILLKTLQQIDTLHALFRLNPSTFQFVDRAANILEAFRAGKIASLIGLEGLHQICDNASILRMVHRLGVRYITLCHDGDNAYVDSAVS
jgi:membrane dipeptidase